MMNAKVKPFKNKETCCPVTFTKPDVDPIDAYQPIELKNLFKILANDTRLHLLHNLARVEEMCVCDLASAIDMKPRTISNQLQKLYNQGFVATRREDNMIYYSVIDECVVGLLEKAMCLLCDSKKTKI